MSCSVPRKRLPRSASAVEAGRVEDFADPRPPGGHEQHGRHADRCPAGLGDDQVRDLADDDDEGQVVEQLEPGRLAMAALARSELGSPRPEEMRAAQPSRRHGSMLAAGGGHSSARDDLVVLDVPVDQALRFARRQRPVDVAAGGPLDVVPGAPGRHREEGIDTGLGEIDRRRRGAVDRILVDTDPDVLDVRVKLRGPNRPAQDAQEARGLVVDPSSRVGPERIRGSGRSRGP